MRICFLISLLIISCKESFASYPNVINIGVYHGLQPTSYLVSPQQGEYVLYGDGEKITDLNLNDGLQANLQGDKIFLKTLNKNIGLYSLVSIVRKSWGAAFELKPLVPNRKQRTYPDDLTISVKDGYLRAVNKAYIEHYVAGVIKAEAGIKKHPEYNKVQAIICRTYALSNLNKHKSEGFHLCDRVHCQVFYGRTTVPNLLQAVVETKGNVLVDHDINMIDALFHSNCGGQTANSEDVWIREVSYLRSKRDSFCLNMPNARWEKTVPKNKWLNYLKSKYNYMVEDSMHLQCAINFQPLQREVFLNKLDSNVVLTQVRKDWKFKSTQFAVSEQNEALLFKGNGFGHGVGLCQEGAMNMANLGYDYTDILYYYYTGVHLVHLSLLDFFRE